MDAKKVEKMAEKRDVKGLIKALGNKEREVCEAAAKALGEIKDPRAVEPLIKALADSNPEAAGALAEMKDPRAVEPLIKQLKNGSRAAAKALGELNDPRAVEPLFIALKESYLREEAGKALGMLKDQRAVEPLIEALGDGDSNERKVAAVLLAELGESKWIELIKGDNDDFLRLGGSKDPRAVEPLINALKHSDGRCAAAKALGNLKDPRAVEPLLEALGYNDIDLREAAAKALVEINDPCAIEPLIEALGNPNARKAAIKVLVMLNDTAAVEPLIKALGNNHSDVRKAAAEVLGMLNNAAAVETLIKTLGDGDSDVRKAAAGALAGLGEQEWKKIIKGEPYDIIRLGESGDMRAVEPLIMILRRKIDRNQSEIDQINELRRTVDEKVLAYALNMSVANTKKLEEKYHDERVKAARSLGWLKDPRAVEPLIEALEDKSDTVREAAARSLGQVNDIRAVEPLIEALRDESVNVRYAAAEALGELKDPRAFIPLLSALKNSDSGLEKKTIPTALLLVLRAHPEILDTHIKDIADITVYSHADHIECTSPESCTHSDSFDQSNIIHKFFEKD